MNYWDEVQTISWGRPRTRRSSMKSSMGNVYRKLCFLASWTDQFPIHGTEYQPLYFSETRSMPVHYYGAILSLLQIWSLQTTYHRRFEPNPMVMHNHHRRLVIRTSGDELTCITAGSCYNPTVMPFPFFFSPDPSSCPTPLLRFFHESLSFAPTDAPQNLSMHD